jgi:hypothetical protein
VRPEDDAGLMALYETLELDDRYRRFFNAYHPRLDFYAELATVQERGGARLVAVLPDEPDDHRIVGEAGYNLLASGHGELGMTVARRWQSWLCACLLDALLDLASAAGVPYLEADVLTVDGPMLQLLASRGSIVMGHRDSSVVRHRVATGDRCRATSRHLDERAIA